jgi:hypothetical protein
VIRTSPDNGSVNVETDEIVFYFDETVSERPSGVPSLAAMFLISPGKGDPRVSWNRRSLVVRPRSRFVPNTTYTITMLPGTVDLQNNISKAQTSLVFSTGASIDSARIRGIVFDWLMERPVAKALVLARKLDADTTPGRAPRDTVYYSTATDSLGLFEFPHLSPGEFEITGFIDGNSNRVLDAPQERYDTARVSLRDSARVEILAFPHDSVPPLIDSVAVRDTFTVIVRFLRAMDPAQAIDTSHIRIVTEDDSTQVPVVLVRPERPFDRLATADSARQDSLARARAVRDTATVRQAVAPSRPRPPQSFFVQVGTPLTSGRRYVLIATGVRGLTGIVSPRTTRNFVVPQRPPPSPR